MYGLIQAPKAWYKRIDSYLSKLGNSKNEADPNIHFKVVDGDMSIHVLYVDDLLIIGEEHIIEKSKHDLIVEFNKKDLGLLHYFLGLEVGIKKNYIFMNQEKYTIDILTKFWMMGYKHLTTPMEENLHKLKNERFKSKPTDPTHYWKVIRSLMYLVNSHNMYYATNALSKFTCEMKKTHLMEAKHYLQYLHDTIGMSLKYYQVEINLHGYSNFDWACVFINCKSSTRCYFSLGSEMISWFNRKKS